MGDRHVRPADPQRLTDLHALIAPRPFLVSGGAEDQPERWKALNHLVAVNKLLGYENRVAMTNRKQHSPDAESNEALYTFFEWALKECGTTAEHTVHIGNRLDTDVRPAKALGIGTIWVLRGEAPPHPTASQIAEADLAVPDLTTVADTILERAGS